MIKGGRVYFCLSLRDMPPIDKEYNTCQVSLIIQHSKYWRKVDCVHIFLFFHKILLQIEASLSIIKDLNIIIIYNCNSQIIGDIFSWSYPIFCSIWFNCFRISERAFQKKPCISKCFLFSLISPKILSI